VKRLLGWVIWLVAAWWLWMLLVGEWNHDEWIAATAAGLVAASLFELMRTRVNAVARVPPAWIKRAATDPQQIFVDFGIITAALFRRDTGVFRSHAFDATGGDAADVGARAWAQWTASFSPNAIPIDIDRDEGTSLVHDLVPNRASEKPA
jgi:hypothetical protein